MNKIKTIIVLLVALNTHFLFCAVAYHNLTDEEQKSRQAVLAQQLAAIQALQNGDPETERCFLESTKFLPADKKSKEKKGERHERECCVCS